MTTLKVTVNKLNLRSSPVKNFANKGNVVGVLHKNAVFESEREITNELGTWHVDGDGHWASKNWLSSLSEDKSSSDFQAFINLRFDGQNLKSEINYCSLLEIDENTKISSGQNVTIGIIDHPISSAISFTNDVIKPFHVADPLFTFHANFIAGLIGGRNGVMGIAKKCTLLELPIYNSRASSTGIDIDAVFQYVDNSNTPMIINVSNKLDKKYNEAIKGFKANKIVVACAGIDEELSSGEIRDPASLPNVLSIGAINKPLSQLPKLNDKIDFVVPNYNYVSYGNSNEQFVQEQGDSFSCAIVSALIALLISSGKTEYDLSSIKSALKKIALPFSTDSFKIFNLINTKP